MDIPNTGAIFTLGKSHLAENTQSYFYIKNDPVRRLTSGANQSAVICESGRLFVWGENHFGQLGVGTNNSNNIKDIITKPTCVKSLKTLGLKIADIAFGNGWAVILTYSNEVFFTGRNIFLSNTKVAQNFTSANIGSEKYSIIRKPFRLEDLDACLSTSEDPENFISISAGNDHFAIMTSVGRLIGWGSNKHHQLGSDNVDLSDPYEVQLDFKVKQFVCGPSSTLILTENGNLFLTGKLSEFTFPQFTELQKNLSAQEEILFMHISQASEIYIVTTEGGIYRSMESTRHNSLIFQRFYDYDNEENGQIVKLLRGTSFFAALTKANKFYTTFSESGHHLKTFREISKFKNLRTHDMVVGDQHILVHGIPRSANKLLNKTFVIRPDSNANIHQISDVGRIVEQNIQEETEEGEENGNNVETIKSNTPVKEKIEEKHIEVKEVEESKEESKKEDSTKEDTSKQDTKKEDTTKQDTTKEDTTKQDTTTKEDQAPVKEEKLNENRPPSTSSSKDLDIFEDTSPTNSMKSSNYRRLDDSEWDSNNSTPSKKTILTANAESSSPTSSLKSRKGSSRSIQFDEKSLAKVTSAQREIRPKTPYPDGTPMKPVKLIAREDDSLDKTSPALHDSLEYIPESVAAFQSDNKQQIERTENKVSAKKRALTPIVRTNETPASSDDEDEQLAVEISSTELLDKTVVNEIRFINNGVDVTDVSRKGLEEDTPVKEKPKQIIDQAGEAIHRATDAAKISATTAAQEAAEKISKEKDKAIEKVSSEAEGIGGKISSTVSSAVEKVSSNVDTAMGKVSEKFDSTVSTVSEGVDNTVSSVSQRVSTTTSKISTKVEDAKQSLANFLTGSSGHKEPSPNLSSNVSTAVTTEETYTPKDEFKIDDDERTTASVNSNLNVMGNTFENERDKDFEPVKRTVGDEIRATGENGKGRVMRFISDLKAKGKRMSCRDEKAVRVADEPPKYTPVDELGDQTDKTSKASRQNACHYQMLRLLPYKLNETNATSCFPEVYQTLLELRAHLRRIHLQKTLIHTNKLKNNPLRYPPCTMTNCEIVIVATTDEPATDIQIPFNVITSAATVSAAGVTTTTHHLAPLQQSSEQQVLQLQTDDIQQQVQTAAGTLPPQLDRYPANSQEKPFQCSICERRFRQLSTLTNHVKIHTGEKPYKCTICDKTFRQSSTLTNHMKIHTGEKPFICSFCPKQFRQLSTLTNHLKIHTGEKPFECAVCKKQFRQSSTLNNHIKIHVMDKVYIPVKIKTEEEEG